MHLTELTAISPIDGRYRKKLADMASYFSEFALIKYRCYVEIEYFIALCQLKIKPLDQIKPKIFPALREIYKNFDKSDAEIIKKIEATINHDVKALEYYLREKISAILSEQISTQTIPHAIEFIHFGLTSQDINNTAFPLMLKDGLENIYKPLLNNLLELLKSLSEQYKNVPMLAHTHGQPASPTSMGKEIYVFYERLPKQYQQLNKLSYPAKFGGATGNFNAHFAALPDIDWVKFANQFVDKKLGLSRNQTTTQIDHYDDLAAIFDNLRRINVILIDLCRDIWLYISMEYFTQKINPDEVGSSAMPHKINPIDFENAEGNLGFANAIYDHLSNKLPISRLQRDLSDSTVLRNIGVPIAHSVLSLHSLLKGLSRLELNTNKIHSELADNWTIVAEAIQTILRHNGYPDPYNALKKLTRTNQKITQEIIHQFIDSLNVPPKTKQQLKNITPLNYTGNATN